MQDKRHSIQQRGDPWFEDGNIILITSVEDTTIAYKIHRGVLARHSEVFRSMFEIAEPPPRSSGLEQCPIVYMHDIPVELSNIIKALYDGVNLLLQNRSIDDFFYVAGILRMSTKYCIPHLRIQAIRHLTGTWSQTLKGHDEMLELALSTPPVHDLSFPYAHPLHVLNLARSTDVRILVPSALYFLSLYPLTDLLRCDHPKLQVEHPSRPSSDLTTQNIQDYTLVFQWRLQLLLEFCRKTCGNRNSTPGCTGWNQCARSFNRLANVLSRQWIPRTGPIHFMKQAMDQLSDLDVCKTCRMAFAQDVDAAREEAWRSLPAVVGLSSWEDLELEMNETTV